MSANLYGNNVEWVAQTTERGWRRRRQFNHQQFDNRTLFFESIHLQE